MKKFNKTITQLVLEEYKLFLEYGNPQGIITLGKHAEFVSQSPKLWMFVACNKAGKLLKEPEKYKLWLQGEHYVNFYCSEYHKALQDVIFAGFEVIANTPTQILLSYKNFDLYYNKTFKTFKTFDNMDVGHTINTLEDLIPYNLELR